MSNKSTQYGIVYLMTNPVLSGLVKIGMTTQHTQDTKDLNNAKDHARELERQLNDLKNKNGGNNIGAIIVAIIITAIITTLLFSLIFE